jgi:hypothetical protein
MDGENKIKKIKNTLVLTPHAFEKWIKGKTPFYIFLKTIILATDIRLGYV